MSETFLVEASPFERFAWVTLEFLEPDQDLLIGHDLGPESPDDVFYLVLANSGPGVVYDSRRLALGLSWTRDSIALRCSRAPAVVTLLLVVARGLVAPDPE